ncbi:hypothetical protein NP493_271g03023 [Ridgeia piscesae]|uniref:Uncharacterized protein n=1 Tax=Ridgeia piscesae TaxID=27915 RepID=A0AAD9UCK7_RIDPI|nr:hypothetical protein NP493_271g03023 [Ridgeia piscesae]
MRIKRLGRRTPTSGSTSSARVRGPTDRTNRRLKHSQERENVFALGHACITQRDSFRTFKFNKSRGRPTTHNSRVLASNCRRARANLKGATATSQQVDKEQIKALRCWLGMSARFCVETVNKTTRRNNN